MKKVLLIISLVILVGCSAAPAVQDPPASDSSDLTAMLSEKDGTIAVLEYQVEDMTQQLVDLQLENDALLVASGSETGDQPGNFMCEDRPASIRYDSVVGAIAIVEGWFATQPFVGTMDGTFSSVFWTGVQSRVHTIRYTSAEDGISTTANFMIMFEEAGWQPGVLYMTDSCWLDYPY